MATDLSPENEQYIQTAIASGLYHDRGEALDRAVELLKKREQLIRDVNLGIEQLERGEGVPFGRRRNQSVDTGWIGFR